MKRFIDVDAFLDEMKYVFNDMSADVNLLTVKNRLETMDGADVVEVVRCKDCKYKQVGHGVFGAFYYCAHPDNGLSNIESETYFCSCGERDDM